MKKTFFQGFAGLLLSWILTSISYGQIGNSVANDGAQSWPEKNIPATKQTILTSDSNFIFRNEISTKAVRNFIREYKDVSDAKWFKSANGLFAVNFTSDGVNNTIYFNKGGTFESVIRYNNEEKLPREVRHLIKSNYYDFSIYHVTEITINRITAYVIIIEDKNSKNKIYWKKIKVVNGEMEVLQEYSQNTGEGN